LFTIPDINSPLLINTTESLGEHHILFGVLPAASINFTKFTFGMTKDRSYLPVHSGFGFKIAGVGSYFWFESPSHIIRFITVNLSTKLSLLVKSIIPRSESWTIPITGLFDYGLTI
jgi:hypothetical protein